MFSGCATLSEVEQGKVEQEPVQIAVGHLIRAVDQAATIAYNRFENAFSLELTQISLTLKTAVSKTTTEDVEPLVFTFDGEHDDSTTQTITVLLKPPAEKRGSTADDEGTTHPELVSGLVDGIHAALLAASGAHAGLQSIHPDGIPFETSEITSQVGFDVTGSTTGGPSITIFGVGVGGNRSRSRETAHTISMVFQVKDPTASGQKS